MTDSTAVGIPSLMVWTVAISCWNTHVLAIVRERFIFVTSQDVRNVGLTVAKPSRRIVVCLKGVSDLAQNNVYCMRYIGHERYAGAGNASK